LKNAKHQRETALLKLEICESQDTAAEMRRELDERQSEIKIRSAALTGNNDKISALYQSIEKLKDESATAQQEMSAQLVAAQDDTATFRDKLEMATHEQTSSVFTYIYNHVPPLPLYSTKPSV